MAQKNKSVGLGMKHGVRKFLLFLLAAFVFALPIFAADTINAEITARNGMVASAQPLASAAGLEILMAGGNAIDAAIAAAFALGVVEPNATGLGGEGMMVIYLAENKTTIAIDYRSMAPLADMSKIKFGSEGHVAVAVPGTVAGLCTALKDYGTKSLAEVMAPAIRYARNGFIVSETLRRQLQIGSILSRETKRFYRSLRLKACLYRLAIYSKSRLSRYSRKNRCRRARRFLQRRYSRRYCTGYGEKRRFYYKSRPGCVSSDQA